MVNKEGKRGLRLEEGKEGLRRSGSEVRGWGIRAGEGRGLAVKGFTSSVNAMQRGKTKRKDDGESSRVIHPL